MNICTYRETIFVEICVMSNNEIYNGRRDLDNYIYK